MKRQPPPREDRYSSKVLQNYARASLPEGLSLKAAAAGAPAEILLYDEIGMYGVTAKDFLQALSQAGSGPIVVRINSPGGDVFDGLAIYNSMLTHTGRVDVVVDGIAASAASFIAMAGTTITMAEQSMLMIHNAWAIAMGDRHVFEDMVSTMSKIDGQLAAIYAGKSGKPKAVYAGMMDDEVWFTSTEAEAEGLCDVVLPGAGAARKAARVKPTAPAPANDAAGLAARRRRLRLAEADAATSETPLAAAVTRRLEAKQTLLTDAATGRPASPQEVAAMRRRAAKAAEDLHIPLHVRAIAI